MHPCLVLYDRPSETQGPTCKTANLVIVNGRITNDSSSNTTFRNISTINYFLCCPLLFKYSNTCIVHEHNPLFSDGHSAL